MKKNVILIGPFPPVLGGVAAINQMIYETLDSSSYNIISFNSSRFKTKPSVSFATGMVNTFLQLAQIISLFYLLMAYNCSLVHIATSSYHSFFKSALVVLIASCMGKRILIHLHGGAFEIFYVKSNRVVKRFIRHILERSHCIITLSEYWRDFLRDRLQVTTRKVLVLHNSYGLEFDKLQDSIQELSAMRNDNLLRILFVGALSMKKGILDLVKICGEVRKTSDRFILYLAGGEGETAIREKVERAIRDNGLRKYIKLLDEVTGEDRLELFRRCDIFILPSYIENCPVAILEAMRAGLPVVTTKVGAIPEILTDQENGFLVPPGDITKFAEKISLLAKNSDLRKSIGCTNLRKALNQFNPECYAFSLTKIYDQILRE